MITTTSILAVPAFCALAAAASAQFTFQKTSYPAGATPDAATIVDLDGDGDLDLASLDPNENRASIWLGDGTGAFGRPRALDVQSGPSDIVAADFDTDGASDFAILSSNAGSFSLFFGNGRGGFAGPEVGPGTQADALTSPVAADFDEDGAVDLAYFARDDYYFPSQVTILPGDGNGAFREPFKLSARADGRSRGAATDLVAQDLDGSGGVDLSVAHEAPEDNRVTFLPDPGNCMLP